MHVCMFVCLCTCRWNKHVKGRDIVSVGCGLKHTLLLLKEGRVLSCGSNEKGQLGQAESITRPGERGVAKFRYLALNFNYEDVNIFK